MAALERKAKFKFRPIRSRSQLLNTILYRGRIWSLKCIGFSRSLRRLPTEKDFFQGRKTAYLSSLFVEL